MRFLSNLIASTLGALIALGLVVLFLFLFLAALAASTDGTPSVRSGSVLVMELSGPIPERVSGDPFMQAFADEAAYGLRDIKLAVRKAAADTRIDGILLRTRGISASWGTLEELRDELIAYKESGKPLIASSGEYYSSEQDYFLTSVSDSIFAAPEGFFEFNGFTAQVAFIAGTLDKLDIEPQVFRSGAYKSAAEPFIRENLSPANEEQLSAILNTQNRIFMEAVAQSRGQSVETLERIATESATLSARSAHEAGLIDGLLFEDEVDDVLKARLGRTEDEDLQTVSLKSYVRVPASDAGLETGTDGEIAVVYAEGTIVPGESDELDPFGGSATIASETFAETMRTVRDDDDIEAVVLRVNSPGGSASASDAIWREIKRTTQQKPVIVSMGGVAASGGYWISTAADSIIADPLTITGSIGVVGIFLDTGDFFDNKLGVTFDGVETSPFADMFTGLQPFSDEERAVLERFIDDTYQAFLEKVADARGMSTDEVHDLAQGRVWIGASAKENGLVDVLGGLDTAIEVAAARVGLAEGTYRIRTFPRPKTFVQRFSESLNARATNAWLKLRTSPEERALLNQLQTLHYFAKTQGSVQARLPMEITIR